MGKFFAKVYDPVMKPLEKRYINRWRERLLSNAKGKVLEIGAGTGINFPLYNKCEEVTAIEPNPHMVEKAKIRQAQAKVPVEIVQSHAEQLPFPENHFDSVVVTLVLCSVEDPVQVLQEIKRVLKPTGTLLVLEHIKMEQPVYAGLQDMLTPVWKHLADGCHLNRKTDILLKENGFEILSRKEYMSGFVVSVMAKNPVS
ncbi:class I SAM-dependent methyltransferase [Pseudalkalibacillus caeni]|uniref:Class I SAM-dependent methyltransferase n=1 Tax=Exobacillus caeni TaxID=2574798 RepID=A0A5R9F3W3_9BACL|nr:class I SAM-dependent methyltransferase [Pseudalkalibacillus caeni]TLS37026.1 class I SAM-dependent methyltransferase [Pseudalkalibacillus caeni]